MTEQPPDPRWAPPGGAPDPYAGYGAPPQPADPYAGYAPPQQQYQQPPYGYQQPYAYQQKPGTNGMAVTSLVLGILAVLSTWILFGIIFSILALVFGYIGRGQINRSGGVQEGQGMALAGIILSYVSIAIFVIVVIAVALDS